MSSMTHDMNERSLRSFFILFGSYIFMKEDREDAVCKHSWWDRLMQTLDLPCAAQEVDI